MRLLIDTHVLVWWETDPKQIPAPTLHLLEGSGHEILVSVVSFWELAIKV